MEQDQQSTPFYRAMMTGVFVGFVDTIICLFFNIFYRGSTDFIPADIINVSSLIFIINIIFVLVGMFYFVIQKTFKKGDLFYMVALVMVTILLVWKTSGVHRSDDPETNLHFKTLLTGIILILGATASFLIPFLFHNKTFEKEVI
jgi:hypothetical protein